jgi:carboxymethylenebutenolidase
MARLAAQITTTDGTCPATLHVPDGRGPWPGVIVFPDAGGARETMRTMADRLAGMGYVVLLPDVYYREADWPPFDMASVFANPDERARLMDFVGTLTRDRIVSDTGAYLDYLLAHPEVSGTAVGTTGYCMGGRISLIAAGAHPDKIAAAASIHGGRLAVDDNPDSPHLAAGRITATVYVAAAQDDPSFTPEQARLLEKALTDAGVRHTLEFYPAQHGFAVPDNPTHDPSAEDRHWKALEELYGAALPN